MSALEPLTRAEIDAINARADEQGRTVQYVCVRLSKRGKPTPTGGRLRVVQAVIRDQAWVFAQKGTRP